MSVDVLVTTSWDDGDPQDLRIAEMLAQHGLTGTFYIPLCHPARPRVSDASLRELASAGFEIGSHGMLHRDLTRIPRKELSWEIGDSKADLEGILGREVHTFCYPIGGHNRVITEHVKRAGYHGARTTRMLATREHRDPWHLPTTVQAFQHNRWRYVRNLIRRADAADMLRACPSLFQCSSWLEIGKHLFDRVLREGGVWHLYGHSWEVQEHRLWDELGELLQYVAHRPGVRYVRTVDTIPSRSLPCLAQVAERTSQ